MSDAPMRPRAATEDSEISLLAIGSTLLRRRRLILGTVLAGLVLATLAALLSPRTYKSTVVFLTGSDSRAGSQLAAVAGQLGLAITPNATNAWGPPTYIEALKSPSLLEPIALDTVIVSERANRRIALVDLLDIDETNPIKRRERAVRALRGLLNTSELATIGGVKLEVTTRWPSVSLTIAQRLVESVDRFNSQMRRSQAKAEREFVEIQAQEAELALRSAENRLLAFMQRNRQIEGSPALIVESERLQREVALRQELNITWLKSREDARVREVRDIPVVTVLEAPRLAAIGESRHTILKAAAGIVAGALIGVIIALLADLLAQTRRAPDEEAQEFFELVEQARPRFLRRPAQR